MRRLLLLGAIVWVLGGCASAPPEPPFEVTAEPTPAGTPLPQPSARTPDPTLSATPSPSLGDNELAIGESLAITRDGAPWASLAVTEVVIERSFAEADGRGRDRPERFGNVFVAAKVTISAVAESVAFDLSGFQATTDTGEEVSLAFSNLGPKPDLLPATLERGDTVSGWVLFEAPEAGRVRLSYAADPAAAAPVEVVLRGS